MRVAPTLLRIAGIGIIAMTILAAVAYAEFMVVWMHAPPLSVLALSAILAILPLVLAWGAFRFASKFSKSATIKRARA